MIVAKKDEDGVDFLYPVQKVFEIKLEGISLFGMKVFTIIMSTLWDFEWRWYAMAIIMSSLRG